MALDEDTVRGIAALARLKVPDADLPHLAGELSNIMGWVEQLQGVPTDGVPPMTSVAEMQLGMREDVIADGGDRDAVLANAPDPEAGFYTVPKVVE